MNLAFVLHGKYFQGGGTGIYGDQIVRRLAKQGNRVWLISNAPRDAEDYFNDGVNYVRIPTTRSTVPFTSLLRWNWRVARVLREIELKDGLDFVEFASYHPEALLYAFSRRNAAICIRVHEERRRPNIQWFWRDPIDAIREGFCWLQMARADVIMPFSEAIHQNCVQFMGSRRQAAKIVTVKSAVDMDFFAPAPFPPAVYRELKGKRIIIFVGRITDAKGTYNLIEAFNNQIAARYPDTALVLVGIPEEPDRLRSAVGAAAPGRVIHLDDVATKDLPAFYSHAYVFAGPSQREAFGSVFVEALACGLPVISVAKGGPLEIVEPEQTGLLCPDNSPSSIAAALDRVLGDRDLRDAMAQSARPSVVERFGMDRLLAESIGIYGQVADQRRQRRGFGSPPSRVGSNTHRWTSTS
jgi:glycosyltransferase involved in cell wall biosynthesis